MTIIADSKRTSSPLAVIDVGTNSLKLLIVKPSHVNRVSPPPACPKPHLNALFQELHFQKTTTRLGNGLRINGRIRKDDTRRTTEMLMSFKEAIHAHECKQLFAFGTHVLRQACNARTTLEEIRKATGIRIKVLSERAEAKYAYLSASSNFLLKLFDSVLVDIGGGSTECVFASRDRITRITSMPLGALHLTRRFLKHDPARPDELERMEQYIWKVSAPSFRSIRIDRPAPRLIASGGSASTLKRMAMHIGKSRMRRRRRELSMEVVEGLLEHCISLPLKERKKLSGLEPDRADIIIAGLSILRIIMQQTGCVSDLLVNDGGVREGVALDLIRRQSAGRHK